MLDSDDTDTDDCLIKSVLSGNDGAFTELISRYKRKIFLIVAKFARDDDELDDVSQEIFVKMYKGLNKYRGDAPFEHWLSKLAVNACYDMLRKRQRDADKVPLETVELSLSGPDSQNTRSRDAWDILRSALTKLRPEDRLVITLLNLEEKSVREISDLTGWSEAKVKVRAFRARKELKKILEKSDEG
jgi:RNA polymerase sigma-70 factor (ECF subfamily)